MDDGAHPRSLNLDQLRTLALVVETGSFSAAAGRLELTQPAVSLQVRQLERRLGARLVERVGRRARPTPVGATLLEHARGIGAAVDGALAAVATQVEQAGGAVSGRVRLGTGATACLHFLPPVLRELRQRHPALQVVVSTGNTADYLRQLEANTTDLALLTLPAPGRALAVTPVLQDEFLAIAGPGLAPLPARVSPARLRALPLVLFEPAANVRTLVDRWFAGEGEARPRPVMELGSVEAIKEMVAAGLGYGIVPALAVTGRAARVDLQASRLYPRLHRGLALVARKDKPVSRGMRAVMEAIEAAGSPAILRSGPGAHRPPVAP